MWKMMVLNGSRKMGLVSLLALSVFAFGAADVQAGGGLNDEVTSSSSSSSTQSAVKVPSVFAVTQQQGPVCPFISFENVKKVRAIRARGQGKIIMVDSDYTSKLQGYAAFLPRIRVLDDAYDRLRTTEGPYKAYETKIRVQGIKDINLRAPNGKSLESMDWFPTNQARRGAFTPYNIKIEQPAGWRHRWLPIIHKGDKLYFYNHETGLSTLMEPTTEYTDVIWLAKLQDSSDPKSQDGASQPYKITDEMKRLMGGNIENSRVLYTRDYLGSPTGIMYSSSSDPLYQDEVFYDFGTYQHMLFACGLDRNNQPLTPASEEFQAHQQFKAEMDSNPLNPWANINKDDLLEYQVARLFQSNPALKAKAMKAVEFYNEPWKFYQESFKCKDASDGQTLGQKQAYLPGEDQMLSYFFTGQLRFLWAATVGMDAVIAIEELEDELGSTAVSALKTMGNMPGVPSVKKIIQAATHKQYGSGSAKYSFVDVWSEIKGLLQTSTSLKDFVTFTGHGCVISIDDDLVRAQPHEDKATAKILGVEMWEQLYEKGFTGLFYQKAGTSKDIIKFGS